MISELLYMDSGGPTNSAVTGWLWTAAFVACLAVTVFIRLFRDGE